jgi:hypothetical protein
MDVVQTSGILFLPLFKKEGKVVDAVHPANRAAIRDTVSPVVATAVGIRGAVGSDIFLSGVTFDPRHTKGVVALHRKQLMENRPKVAILGQ